MSGFPLLGTGVAGTPGGPAALSATGSVLLLRPPEGE